ncbi:CGGC domain-containing protein, partial [Megamonas funiformis]
MYMKNIAILTCLKANDVCTGASWLDAFYNKKGFFTQYTNDDTKLVAFWT